MIVSRWDLNETSGSTANDSVDGNDGTLVGDPIWAGPGLELDGSTDHVAVPGPSSLSSFTVSVWAKWAAAGDYAVVTDDPTNAKYFLFVAANTVYFRGDGVVSSSYGGVILGEWQHFAVTRDSNVVRFYHQGVELSGNGTDARLMSLTGLGGYTTGGNFQFAGTLGPVEAHDAALSAAEVAVLAASPPQSTNEVPALAQGPGGDVLVVGSNQDQYSWYLTEILRCGGITGFDAVTIEDLDAQVLADHQVVVLGTVSLASSGKAPLVEQYVEGGGCLVAVRPEDVLEVLLGLGAGSFVSTLDDAYWSVDTSFDLPGHGLPADVVQYHGPMDLRSGWSGPGVLADVWTTKTVAAGHPAVTRRTGIGAGGGTAYGFYLDVARSVAWTRQGNPAWSGQSRTGLVPRRKVDLFYDPGGAHWIDWGNAAIPQADVLVELFCRVVADCVAGGALPRLPELPGDFSKVVVLTGDGHPGDAVSQRLGDLLQGEAGKSVDDWQRRGMSVYVYPDAPLTDAEAAAVVADGNVEVALHPNTNGDVSAAELDQVLNQQLDDFSVEFPSLPLPNSLRTHAVAHASFGDPYPVQIGHDLGGNLDDYHWWPDHVVAVPGYLTGSAKPMRAVLVDGTMVDAVNTLTVLQDETTGGYDAAGIDAVLDDGHRGYLVANMHVDVSPNLTHDHLVAAVDLREVPIISAEQMFQWWKRRSSMVVRDVVRSPGRLEFNVIATWVVRNVHLLIPHELDGVPLSGVRRNGVVEFFGWEVVQGVTYARVEARDGSYVALYV